MPLFWPDPGAANFRCRSARMLAGVTFATAAWTLFFQPLTTSPSPRIIASKPDLATSAGPSVACRPTLKSLSEAMTGIGEERIHGAALSHGMERVDAGGRRQVSLHGLDLDAELPQGQGRVVNLGLVRGDQGVVPVIDAALRQLVPDPDDAPVMMASGRLAVLMGAHLSGDRARLASPRARSSDSAASQSAISSSSPSSRCKYR
jgi:hypothetical protein